MRPFNLLNYILVELYFIVAGLSQPNYGAADYVTSSNYVIQYCGNYAPVIQRALRNTYNSLQQAIGSMDPTSPVYKAFLNGVDPNDVKALFGRISAGINIILPSGQISQPTIVCINNQMEPLWTGCKNGHHSASAAENTQWVFLCPMFWLILIPTTLPFHCGSVDSASTCLAGPDLTQTQYTVLVHELVHLYLDKPKLKPEVYHVNDCIALPASQAAINPQNFALYAANVQAGCTEFPTRLAQQPDHEGLEADFSQYDDNVEFNGGCTDTDGVDPETCAFSNDPGRKRKRILFLG